MAAPRIVVFGATGYTGRLTAERLAAAGAAPVLAGRDPAKLARIAEEIGGGLETAHADVMRQNSVFELVGPGDVLISTVGPFAKWGEPAVRAAIAVGATYIDSTGEPAFIRRVFEEFDAAAADAGAALMTAMGYDWVPGQLAAALALEAAGPEAVRVDVGYYALGAGAGAASAGTMESLVGAMLDSSHAFRDGRIQLERGAARVRSFLVGGKERAAISVGGSEHFTLPRAYPQLEEVNVYLGWFGPLSRAVQGASFAGSVVTRVPGTRSVLQAVGERAISLAPARASGDPTESSSVVMGAAYGPNGEQLTEVELKGVDGYEFTAGFLAWAARQAAAGAISATGAVGPITAFGLPAVEAGAAEAGIAQ